MLGENSNQGQVVCSLRSFCSGWCPRGIDEARYVPIGGIDQYMSIRGENRDNPVILFLHCGPGDATNPWGYVDKSSAQAVCHDRGRWTLRGIHEA
jgi:hypothetical protein